MNKTLTLKDGSTVRLRPLSADDGPRTLEFFRALPEDERIYLRADMTEPENVERRFRRIEFGEIKCLVALEGERIVADAGLELGARAWKTHLAEIRLFVAESHRRLGLGVLMARELHALAIDMQVEEIMVRMMRPQQAARSIVRRLGFREDAVLTDYVKDLDGRLHDLLVMRCDIAALWREMEGYLATGDWQRARYC